MEWWDEEEDPEAELLQLLSEPATIPTLSPCQKSQGLVIAARRGDAPLVWHLLEHGAKPNGEDELGHTPLMFAAGQGMRSCIQEMLQWPGCVVNKRTESMQTALHFAAEKGQKDCVELLLNNRAMVNVADDWGMTPLIMAVKCGCLDTVSTLLQHGARVNMTNLQSYDAVMHAARCGHVDILDLLLKRGGEANKMLKTSPLHQAATYGHVACVQTLLRHGAKVDLRDIHHCSAIELATQTDKSQVVKCIVEHGITEDEEEAALSAAARHNATDSLDMLLKLGVSPDVTDAQGIPAFFWAVAENNVDIVRCLIRQNYDVNKHLGGVYLYNSELRDLAVEAPEDFINPVIIATLRGYTLLVQILVRAGASPSDYVKLQEADQLPACLAEDSNLNAWIRCYTSSPTSLLELCRSQIRLTLGTDRLPKQIYKLPLPNPIKHYLNFSDLDSM